MPLKLKPLQKTSLILSCLGLVLGIGVMASVHADSPKVVPTVQVAATQPATPAITTPSPQPAVSPTPPTAPKATSVKSATSAVPTKIVTTTIPKTTQLFAAPASSQVISNAANATARASDASVLNRLASKPTAVWFGDWSGDIRAAVNSYVGNAQAAGRLPVLVAYNIPNRDCNGQSAGGAANASAYASWINGFAAGIAGRQAIVIVEPDAVAADCFDSARAAMLTNASASLQKAGATVYLDAGNATWRTPGDMATRLNQAGIGTAAGFSLNISNYQTTAANISYGTSLSKLLGGKHFIIDTSRNGRGPNASNDWCNPDGRALGAEPTLQTGNTLVDALLWVKVPGESDGTCGPSQNGVNPPAAGTYWPEYALMLARNAGW